MKDSTSAESRTTWEARTRTFWISKCSAWLPPGAPRRSRTTAPSSRPRTRSLSPGSAAAAASSRSAGCPPWWGAAARPRSRSGAPRGRPRVVHLVEALHGLALVVLAALQQIMHGHGAAVVVYVVAALPIGEDLDPLNETGWVRSGRRQRVGGVRVSEGDLDRLGIDERGAAGQRNAADPRGGGGEGAQQAGEILHVVPCGHVVGVAGFQLVVQALHQLILCSGCDYLHASLHVAQHSFSLVRPRRV